MSGRGPRNFLAGGEYRRLFWRFMPPALLTLIAVDWLMRTNGPPGPTVGEPALDTRIEAFADPRPAPGTVVIAPAVADAPGSADDSRAASAEALAAVRDVAFFRSADHAAWAEICGRLRAEAATPRPPAPDASLGELLGMPKSFRGRPVRIKGTLRRLEQLEPPASAAEVGRYWQGWLEPAEGPAAPVMVHLLDLPAGTATGLAIREPVIIDGYFLKAAAYRAADGVRVAPLILAATPLRPPTSPNARSRQTWSLGVLAAGTLTALMIALGFGVLAGGRRRRRVAVAADVAATLAGFDPVTIADAMRPSTEADRVRPAGDQS